MTNVRKIRERRERRKEERRRRGNGEAERTRDKTPGIYADASLWISKKK
jgi:hypothetical protein